MVANLIWVQKENLLELQCISSFNLGGTVHARSLIFQLSCLYFLFVHILAKTNAIQVDYK